jgi:hypothetical protein
MEQRNLENARVLWLRKVIFFSPSCTEKPFLLSLRFLFLLSHSDRPSYLCCKFRFVEKNRRDVEEKTEQLKAISNLAALFAGFAVVTLTQFTIGGIDDSTDSLFWNEPSTVVSDCCSTPPKFFVSAIRTTLLMSMARC